MTRTVSSKLANVLSEGRKRIAERKTDATFVSETLVTHLDQVVSEGFVALDENFFAKRIKD